MKSEQSNPKPENRPKKERSVWMIILITVPMIIGLSPVILIVGIKIWYSMSNADCPAKIERRAHVSLPEYRLTDKYDNLDRSASTWTEYGFDIEFKEPFSEKSIRKLKRQGFEMDKDSVYGKGFCGGCWSGTILVDPNSGAGYMFYTFNDFLW